MVDIITEIVIARSPDFVSAYAANPDNAPEWYVKIKSAEWKTPKPLSIGSQIIFRAEFLGRKLEYTYEIKEFVRSEKLVMQTAEGPFPMETRYTWDAIENGQTKMTLRNRGEPAGFSVLFIPFMKFAIRRANRKDLARLKQILENSSHS